jgi:hypothetical protein
MKLSSSVIANKNADDRIFMLNHVRAENKGSLPEKKYENNT